MALQNAKYMASGAVAAPGGNQKSGNAWSQIDQLLTCAICLDRYRNPKLLPCQHTFCMEPCIEGLIDYVRRQIKCPECRAEHRIPYQGIQGYPTNVTLMRFLELHFEVTGEIPDPSPCMMERCGVCSEKQYLSHCAHCEKKVCSECKDAHMDITKREISRINNQVKRGLNRLQDALCQVTKSSDLLQLNATSVSQEIEETYRRLIKSLKEREDTLKLETNLFLQNELKTAEQLKENLETEVTNIQSNCDLVDQHVTEKDEWEDVELLEYKDILLKTLEFLRNYDTDQADFNRRLKFQLGPDSESIRQTISNAGELIVNAPNFPGSCVTNALAVTSSAVLSRSKSDHRLAQSLSASQLQQRHHEGYLSFAHRGTGNQGSDTESREGRSSPLTRRRTGELPDGNRFRGRELEDERSLYSSRRSQNKDYNERSWQRDETEHSSGYRSRFARERDDEEGGSKSVRFSRHQETNLEPPPPREKVFETDDVTKGPISGITKLMDSSKVMERLKQQEQAKVRKEAMKLQQQQQQPVVSAPASIAPLPQRPVTNRQVSEDDEVAKQKAQNKAAAAQQSSQTATSTTTAAQDLPTRQPVSRTSSVQRQDSAARGQPKPTETYAQTEESAALERRRLASRTSDTSLQRPTNEVSTTSDSQSLMRKRAQASAESSKPTDVTTKKDSPQKADDDEEEDESESESEESEDEGSPSHDNSGKPNPLDELTGQEKPNYFRYRTAGFSRTPSNSSVNISNDSQDESGRSGAHSPSSPKVLPFTTKTKSAVTSDKRDSSSTSSPSDSTSHKNSASNAPLTTSSITKDDKNTALTGSLLKNANESKSSNLNTQDKPDISHNSSGKTYSVEKTDTQSSTKPRFVSRFLPRSSSLNQENKPDSSSSDSEDDTKTRNPREESSSINALLARSAMARKEPNSPANRNTYGRSNDDSSVGSWRSSAGSGNSYLHNRDDYKKDADSRSDTHEGRYSSLANKYLNRSRPSLHDDERETSYTSKYGSGGYANRYLSKSKSSAVLASSFDKDDADDQSGTARRSSLVGRDSSGSASSSKERYRDRDSPSSTRYGSRNSAKTSRLGRSKSSHEIALEDDVDDDDDLGTTYSARFERPSDYTSRRRSHQSREQSPDEASSGATGSGGLSSWARYLKSKYGNKGKSDAGKDNGNAHQPVGRSRSSHTLNSREASSDSSDDECGIGSKVQPNAATKDSTISYSPGYRGMTSSRTNSSDSNQVDRKATSSYENPRSTYQHKQRVGMKIGSRGSEPGSFTWPRGIAVGPDSSIVVADSSNHRVQVFNSQGTFCKEFGTYGSGEGEFDCLAGVAVNRIGQYIISDRYNHRIQVFDPSGRFLRCFGSQGTSDGKLNCPWGVATDSLGFIYVCDKENHRIQVFQSDGTFVGKFGSLGNKQGQLEHPHYIAVSNTNKVIISDSNNHRIQIFDVNGRVLSSFGSEGTDGGQFKFPRGIAVDDQGYIIVGDSGNNRIQIFQSDGTFIKSFGTWGSGDSEFKGLEGVSVMQDGRILVCDRENHRVQIF